MDCGRLELSVLLTPRNSTVDLMSADSFSNCCYNKPWVVRGGIKVLKESKYRVLHSVALCAPLSVGYLKCHLSMEHMQIKAVFTK